MAEQRWKHYGIQPVNVYAALRQAATARMDYEDRLVNDRELAKDEIAYRTFVRGLNQRLDYLSKWLEHYSWLPDGQVVKAHLVAAVSRARSSLSTLAPHVHRTFAFKGRPGEPWLRPVVEDLSRIFRRRGIRGNVRIRFLLEALALAGHGDVANLASVKRLITRP